MADSGSGGGTIIDQVIKGLALPSGTTDSTKPTPQPQPVDRPAADMSYFPPNGQQSQGNGIPGPDPSSQAADLALPQPSSSGNLDLASVNKPPSTGLQDIINRARPHAQQLMRAARGRKDDAPNPYMDERRSHKSFSNRNRSRSPSRNDENRRGYRDRSPVSEEIVVVQTSAVGHIMGKLGRTISMIEKHTGAKIQFDDNRVEHGATRTCTVKGDSSQRAAAIREIRRAESNAQAAQDRGTGMPSTPGGRSYQGPGYMQPRLPGEEHDRIYVPTMSAGLIIGKSGDTIKTTQQTTGATIAIAEESQTLGGWRPVDITGTPPCLWAAQKAINDIVKSDTRVDWMSLPLQPGYPALATPPTGMRELVRVPNQSVGVIIGKHGDTVKSMQQMSGAKIDVHQNTPVGNRNDLLVEIVGPSPEIVNYAKSLVTQKVDASFYNVDHPARNASTPTTPGYNPYPSYPSYGAPYAAPPPNPPQSQYFPQPQPPMGYAPPPPHSPGAYGGGRPPHGGYPNQQQMYGQPFNPGRPNQRY